jgi:hypothetical protein
MDVFCQNIVGIWDLSFSSFKCCFDPPTINYMDSGSLIMKLTYQNRIAIVFFLGTLLTYSGCGSDLPKTDHPIEEPNEEVPTASEDVVPTNDEGVPVTNEPKESSAPQGDSQPIETEEIPASDTPAKLKADDSDEPEEVISDWVRPAPLETVEDYRGAIKDLNIEIKRVNSTYLQPIKDDIKAKKAEIADPIGELKTQLQITKQGRNVISEQIKTIRASGVAKEVKRLSIAALKEDRAEFTATIKTINQQISTIQEPWVSLKEQLKNHPATAMSKALKLERTKMQEEMYLLADVNEIQCDSQNFVYAQCALTGKVLKWELVEQLSNTECVRKTNYGRKGRHLWVDAGCRAKFRVLTY